MNSAFPNAGSAGEDTQGGCVMKRRLQRKLPEVKVAPVSSAMHLACRYLKPQVSSGYLTKAPRGYLGPSGN